MPEDLDPNGWVGEVVSAVLASGSDLDRPRFVHARLHQRRAVGVACRASLLSDSMHAESQGRPLFTFVGWVADDTAQPPGLPELAGQYRTWAGQVYERWLRDVWGASASELRDPPRTTPEPPPWPSGPLHPADSQAWPDAEPGRVHAYPAAAAADLWRRSRSAAAPFVLAVGWPAAARVKLTALSHLAADDVAEPAALDRPDPWVFAELLAPPMPAPATQAEPPPARSWPLQLSRSDAAELPWSLPGILGFRSRPATRIHTVALILVENAYVLAVRDDPHRPRWRLPSINPAPDARVALVYRAVQQRQEDYFVAFRSEQSQRSFGMPALDTTNPIGHTKVLVPLPRVREFFEPPHARVASLILENDAAGRWLAERWT
ncbi:hypothetical protein [Dactylosporangium sp. CA-092794]|uniref:hypothetical protein n=1 Tax=Dactylosporangium sp. CA-092794 TaxID=3239929 RepID=UPI003D943874